MSNQMPTEEMIDEVKNILNIKDKHERQQAFGNLVIDKQLKLMKSMGAIPKEFSLSSITRKDLLSVLEKQIIVNMVFSHGSKQDFLEETTDDSMMIIAVYLLGYIQRGREEHIH